MLCQVLEWETITKKKKLRLSEKLKNLELEELAIILSREDLLRY